MHLPPSCPRIIPRLYRVKLGAGYWRSAPGGETDMAFRRRLTAPEAWARAPCAAVRPQADARGGAPEPESGPACARAESLTGVSLGQEPVPAGSPQVPVTQGWRQRAGVCQGSAPRGAGESARGCGGCGCCAASFSSLSDDSSSHRRDGRRRSSDDPRDATRSLKSCGWVEASSACSIEIVPSVKCLKSDWSKVVIP